VKRLLLFGPIIYALLFLGLLTHNGEPLAFIMPFLVYLGASLLYSPEKISLKVTRNLSDDRVSQGASIEVRLEVTNQGSRLEELFLEDFVPMPFKPIDGTASLLTSLAPDETVKWKYRLRANRGYYRFQGVGASANDYLGLFRRQTLLPAESRLTVLPHSVKLKRVTIKPRRTRVYSGFIPARSGGHGIEFFGVREHQSGDPYRLINWKATARHPQRFFTNEYEQERVADVGLILDARQRSYLRKDEESLFEHAVSATTALADAFLNDGNRVGVYIYGRVVDWTIPGYGKIQKERILQALARAKLGEHQVFDRLEHLPARLFPSHSQLIFISPLIKDDRQTLFRLRARGYQVMVVTPDPISFEESRLKQDRYIKTGRRIALLERSLMLHELRQAGVQVFDWCVETPFHHAASFALTRQPLWRY